MKFKVNLHKAKKCKLPHILHQIQIYPMLYKFKAPKYLLFIKEMMEAGWEVRIYEVKISKYIFLIKGDDIFKVRFSNHKPIYEREMAGDCDYYVGVSHTATHRTEEIIKLLKK